MVFFNLFVQNPFAKDNFKNIFDKSGTITKNKKWEVQLYQHDPALLELILDTRFNGNDHAGPNITLGLLSYVFTVKLYDSRHWDYKNNKWIENEDCN